MQDNQTPSDAVMILQLLGYVLAFAVPTTIAAVLLPAYAGQIVVGAGLLFFAVSAFILGWQWDDPGWTRQTRMHMLQSAVSILVFVIVIAVMDGMREGAVHHRLASSGIAFSVIAASALIGFFAGRSIHRHRQRAQAD